MDAINQDDLNLSMEIISVGDDLVNIDDPLISSVEEESGGTAAIVPEMDEINQDDSNMIMEIRRDSKF